MDETKLKKICESLLFASEEPLTARRAADLIGEVSENQVVEAFRGLAAEIDALNRSFQIVEVAEGWQFVTRPDYHTWVKALYKVVVTTRLTKPALEVLAIIAYKQPVTRAEVEAIRGVDVSSILQNLLQKKMIRILGRAEAAGRPLLYGTTREFLLHFGLKSLSDLPRVSEIQDLAGGEEKVMKEMESELRRRQAKLGLLPLENEEEKQEPSGEMK